MLRPESAICVNVVKLFGVTENSETLNGSTLMSIVDDYREEKPTSPKERSVSVSVKRNWYEVGLPNVKLHMDFHLAGMYVYAVFCDFRYEGGSFHFLSEGLGQEVNFDRVAVVDEGGNEICHCVCDMMTLGMGGTMAVQAGFNQAGHVGWI